MKLKLLILVLALQSAWVLGTVITQERTLREGTGNPRGKLTVQAVVAASGNAAIKQVFADGKTLCRGDERRGAMN
ncbi:MAG TPA: hypothetical protein VIJ24_07790 [Verrucomicrobiae bacterium]